MSFPRYPKYKDSGVEWLGEVPEHWDVVQFKQFVEIQNGSDHKHVERDEGYPVLGSGGIFTYASDFLYDGESVLLGRKGTIDKPLHVTGRFWTVDTMYWTKIKPNSSGRFAYYLAVTIPFDYYSTNTALPSMTKSALNSHFVSQPPLPEQTRIAEFLDRETAKTDELVAEQRRLMELLKEKRQAVISHAVTKGLNPNAPMKPSGIEWLGDVPAHWEVLQLRRVVETFVDYRGKTPSTAESGIPLVTATAVRDGQVDHGRAPQYITQETYDKWMVRGFPSVGDVVFTTEGATFGETGQIVDASVALAQRLILFKADPKRITNGFLFYLFVSDFGQAEQWSNTTGTTVFGIKASKLKAIRVVVPPLVEQTEIEGDIHRETHSFQAAEAEAQRAIDLLQERRTALISAAVTGQIDVRNNS